MEARGRTRPSSEQTTEARQAGSQAQFAAIASALVSEEHGSMTPRTAGSHRFMSVQAYFIHVPLTMLTCQFFLQLTPVGSEAYRLTPPCAFVVNVNTTDATAGATALLLPARIHTPYMTPYETVVCRDRPHLDVGRRDSARACRDEAVSANLLQASFSWSLASRGPVRAWARYALSRSSEHLPGLSSRALTWVLADCAGS